MPNACHTGVMAATNSSGVGTTISAFMPRGLPLRSLGAAPVSGELRPADAFEHDVDRLLDDLGVMC